MPAISPVFAPVAAILTAIADVFAPVTSILAPIADARATPISAAEATNEENGGWRGAMVSMA